MSQRWKCIFDIRCDRGLVIDTSGCERLEKNVLDGAYSVHVPYNVAGLSDSEVAR